MKAYSRKSYYYLFFTLISAILLTISLCFVLGGKTSNTVKAAAPPDTLYNAKLTYSYSSSGYTVTGIDTSDSGTNSNKTKLRIVVPSQYDDGINGLHNVVEIAESAFDKQKKYADYTFVSLDLSGASNLTKIGDMAFRSTALTGSIVIPDKVTYIGANAFRYCSSLDGNVIISDSVVEIKELAFQGCTSLKGVYLPKNDATVYTGETFKGSTNIKIYVPTTELKSKFSTAGHALYAYSGQFEVKEKLLVYSVNSSTITGFNTTYLNSLNANEKASLRITITATYNGKNVTAISDDAFNATKTNNSSYTFAALDLSGATNLATIGKNAFNGCSGFTGSLTIPNKVTAIGDSAFYNCSGFNSALNLSSATSLASIGTSAFSGCSGFTSVTFPNSVKTISDYAFNSCTSLNSALNLPTSLTAIGASAFYNCNKLSGSLTIPNSVTAIGASAFYNCSGFNSALNLSSATSLASIGANAFSGCSSFTHSLTIPNSVTTIGSSAFNGCSGFTGNLTIPNSVTTIGSSAFNGCSGFTGNLKLSTNAQYTVINSSTFAGCTKLSGSLTIPNNVTNIQSSAFSGCSGFTGSLTIPNSVTKIGANAFNNCTNFLTIYLPDNASTTYDATTFLNINCPIVAPDGLYDTLHGGKLSSYTNLTYERNVAFKNGFQGELSQTVSQTKLFGFPLNYTKNNTSLVWAADGSYTFPEIPNNGLYYGIGYSLAQDDTTLITQNTLVNQNDYYAVYAPIYKTSIVDGGYSINGFADGYLSSLTPEEKAIISIVIPATYDNLAGGGEQYVVAIGDNAFNADNSNYTGYTFTELGLSGATNLVTIGAGAFFNCSGFTGDLTIPENVTTINVNAFNGCSRFTGDLKIPNSVTTIGDSAFEGCENLNGKLTLPENTSFTTISDRTFNGCSNFTGSLTIPNSVTTIGFGAFLGCFSFNGTLTLPKNNSGFITISGSAFEGCSNFTGSLTIPNSVTTIGSSAFNNCTSLQTIYLPNNNNTDYGASVFDNITCPLVAPDGLYDTLHASGNLSSYTNLTYELEVKFENDLQGEASQTVKQTKLFGYALNYNIKDNISLIWAEDTSYKVPTAPNKDLYYGTGYSSVQNDTTLITKDTKVNQGTYYAVYAPIYNTSIVDGGGYSIDGFADEYLSSLTTNEKVKISIVIPATYNDNINGEKNVVAIGANAFNTINYTSCMFISLDLSGATNLVTIGEKGFFYCDQLEGNLIIPDKVETIGSHAFSYCSKLTGNLTIPDSVKTIDKSAFVECYGFDGKLTLPNNDSFTTINDNTFVGCTGFTGNLIIPESVTTIGISAFEDCYGFDGILKIPDSVTYIGFNRTFNNCKGLQTVYLPNNNETYYGASVFGNVACPIIAPNPTLYNTLHVGDLSSYTNLTYELEVTFEKSLQGEPSQTESQTKLFGFSLKYIKDDISLIWMVSSTYELPTVPKKDLYLDKGYSAQNDTTLITKDTKVNQGTYYAVYAPFYKTSIVEGGFSIDGFNIDYLSLLTTNEKEKIRIVIPATYNDNINGEKNVVAIGANAFDAQNQNYSGCIFISLDLSGATNLVTIGDEGFYNRYQLTGNLIIPNKVETIGTNAFSFCSNLTGDLKIPNSVTTIGFGAFNGCSSFNGTLTLPNNLDFKTIDSRAFFGCSGLTGVLTIPDSVTSIGDYAFGDCSGFTGSLVIPNSVTTIGEEAFGFCTSLETVYLPNNSGTTYGVEVFVGVTCPLIAPTKDLYNTLRVGDLSPYSSLLTYEFEVTFENDLQGEPSQTVSQTKLFGFSLNYTKNNTSLVWAENTSYKLPEPINNAFFAFSGFFTAHSGGDLIEPNRVINSDPCTFYAVYTERIVASIIVEKNPAKTAYKAFENFDKSGMQVKLMFTDGTSIDITDYAIRGGNDLRVGTSFVTVVYVHKDKEFSAKVNITVSKADIDLSGITFDDLTVKEDGNLHKLEIIGNLPSGVSVTYSGSSNYNLNGVSAAGVYTVTVTFTVTENYNTPSAITKTLTINKSQLVTDDSNDNSESDTVIIETEEGFDPTVTLQIKDITDEAKDITPPSTNTEVKQVYEMSMFKGEQKIQPNGDVSVKLLIREDLRNQKNLKVYATLPNGVLVPIEATREGDYFLFSTSVLDRFIIVGDTENSNSQLIMMIIMIFCISLLVCIPIILLLTNHAQKPKNATAPKNANLTNNTNNSNETLSDTTEQHDNQSQDDSTEQNGTTE